MCGTILIPAKKKKLSFRVSVALPHNFSLSGTDFDSIRLILQNSNLALLSGKNLSPPLVFVFF